MATDDVRKDLRAAVAARQELALAIISIVAAIPITAIAAGMVGLEGVIIGWLGLVAINFARTMARRR